MVRSLELSIVWNSQQSRMVNSLELSIVKNCIKLSIVQECQQSRMVNSLEWSIVKDDQQSTMVNRLGWPIVQDGLEYTVIQNKKTFRLFLEKRIQNLFGNMDLKFRTKRDFQNCSGKKNPEHFWKYASEIQDKKGLPELFRKKIQNFSRKCI